MRKPRDVKQGSVRKPVLKQGTTKARIRVQLDNRTVITIPDMEALKLWKVKYPNAVIISS